MSGAAEALRSRLIQMIGDRYFQLYRRSESAAEAIFTRKVGHTQRGGRPILFDRFYAAQLGAKAVDLLMEGHNNARFHPAIQHLAGFSRGGLRRQSVSRPLGPASTPGKMHPALYDPKHDEALASLGMEYLMPIFTDAIGWDDMEHHAPNTFAAGQPARTVSFHQHGHQQTHPVPREREGEAEGGIGLVEFRDMPIRKTAFDSPIGAIHFFDVLRIKWT